MGHRCSFAIKDGNAVELFYGHWSAIQVPDQLFWGPDFVETYIRGHEAVDWWVEDIFADGCVGFDKDQKVLLVHRGVGDLSGGFEGVFFYGLMRALWKEQGWRVEKVGRMEEIPMHMGYPLEAVRWMPEPEAPWPRNSTPSARFGTNTFSENMEAVRNRVFETLILPAHDPVPGFVASMTMLGATISPGVATSPPEHNLSMKERSALVERAIELLFEGHRK